MISDGFSDDAARQVGQPVWGSDYNAAYSLLFRWWGTVAAPSKVDIAPFWEDLLGDDIDVVAPDIHARGPRDVMAAVAAIRAGGERSYDLGLDDMRLSWIGRDLFQLDARFVEQNRAAGGVVTRRCSYRAELSKRTDGRLVFRRIEGAIEGDEPAAPFVSHYETNRAKATMIQFQTHADLLSGDAEPMRELLMAELELNGLVNSKTDETTGDEATFTNVNSLRQNISNEKRRLDNVIRNYGEFSSWFLACASLFRKGGFHKLEVFEVTPLADRRCQVVAQFNWKAETVNGAKIDLHTPLTWILAETGDKYMRIEKLLPFG